MDVLYPLVLWSWINVCSSAEIRANQSFSMIREDQHTDLFYVADGNKIRVLDSSSAEVGGPYEVGPDQVNKYDENCQNIIQDICDNQMDNFITLMELVYIDFELHIFVCMSQDNGTCYLISATNRTKQQLLFTESETKFLTSHYITTTSLKHDPEYPQNDSFHICLGRNINRNTDHRLRLTIAVLRVSWLDYTISLISQDTLKARSTYNTRIVYSFVYNFMAYYVLNYFTSNFDKYILLQLQISNNEKVQYTESYFNCTPDANLVRNLRAHLYEDNLILLAEEKICFTTMEEVQKHFSITEKECAMTSWIKNEKDDLCKGQLKTVGSFINSEVF